MAKTAFMISFDISLALEGCDGRFIDKRSLPPTTGGIR